MALDFSVLTRKPTIADSYSTGQQEARQEAEQNMLRQMQMEQMAAQRDQRLAVTAERQAKTESASRRQQFLSGLSAKMAEGGYKLDRATLGQMLNYGMQSGEESLIKLAADGMKALDEDDLYRTESARLGMAPGAAPAGPSVMRQPAAALPAAPAAPTNLLAGTPFDIGGGAPAAPANALAAPAGVTREMVQNMMTSPSPRIREQGKALAQTLPKESDVATMQALGFPLTQQGYEQFRAAQRQDRLKTPEEEAQAIRVAIASRPLPQPREPREPSAPVAVVDQATGTVKYVTREEALGKTPANAIEGLAPKEIQRREAVFPQAKQSVTTVTNTMSTIEETIDRLLKNKSGLNGVTGLVYGITPALTDAARAADADLEQLANLAFVQGITELRAASKTGAGVGNVSNKEGDRFENLKASLKRTQSYADMVAALTRLKAQAGSTKDTVTTEFNDMYDYRQDRAAPTTKPSLASIFSTKQKP
jgi:hypothetical protein